MSETMTAALIGLAGTTITAITTIVVALIQTRKLRNEKETAREDRDIAAQTVRTQEIELEVLREQESSSGSGCSGRSGGAGQTPGIRSAGTGGVPT